MKKQTKAKSAYDWREKAKADYDAMGIEQLEALVLHHENESRVDAFMGSGFNLAMDSAERHFEKMLIAESALAERSAVVERLVNEAFAA